MTLFRDRRDAGRQLAEALTARTESAATPTMRDLVLALPRGGVPVAAEVARAVGAPLDVVVVRKLGAPGHEELAIGAIAAVARPQAEGPDSAGAAVAGLTTVLNDGLIATLAVSPEAVERVKAAETAELRRRERAYRGGQEPLEVAGRKVIVIDDGVATGATMIAAARSLREAGAEHVTVAVPVAPVETVAELRKEADDVVCLEPMRNLQSVGQWYDDFSQTTDEEVTALLAGHGRPR